MKYPFEVYRMKVNDHEFWAAESKALKGCVAQGDTCQEACDELEKNEEVWLETAAEFDIAIPEIPYEIEEQYSGKFTVRVSPFEHRKAAEQAKKLGISLNQYVNDAIVNYTAETKSAAYISKAVANSARDIIRHSVTGASFNAPAISEVKFPFNITKQPRYSTQ